MPGDDVQTWYTKLALAAGRGNVIPWSKTGYNGDVDIGTEDVWTAGGIYSWPAAAGPMEVISTGAGAGLDVAAGAGVQQVRICYLDNTYTEQCEILTMTGGVAAPTAAVNILRINSFRAYRVGGNYVAGGTIIIRPLGGGATYSEIVAGYTRSRTNEYTVPFGKTLYVTSLAFSAGSSVGGGDVLFTTRATYDDASARVLAPNFFIPYHEIQLQDKAWYRDLEIPTRLPATVDIKVSAMSGANNQICTSVLRGFLVTG